MRSGNIVIAAGGLLRSRISRHLGHTLEEATTISRDSPAARPAVRTLEIETEVPPPELNGHDYAIFLLRVAAEIEHALLVQYLFSAYSLGGPNVPEDRRADVRAWQETILGIAKEEMGHLITIENLLTALGGPLNFNRDDYPYDSALYPFGFTLQPASLDSLATYVCAESPPDWDNEEAREITHWPRPSATGHCPPAVHSRSPPGCTVGVYSRVSRPNG